MSRAWAVFLLSSANFLLSQFYRSTNAVIAPQLISDLGLDTQSLGLLSAAFFYAFGLTQIPITIFLDRIGARRMMAGFSVAGILGALVFSWSGSLATGVAGRILLGVGMACHLMGTLKLLTLWFTPLQFATLSGVVLSLGTLGNMAATTPFVVLVEWLGWREAYRSIAAANLLLTLIFYLVVRDRPGTASHGTGGGGPPRVHSQALSDLRLLLKNKDYWIISYGSFVRYGLFAAFQTLWAGPFLMEGIGLSAVAAGNLIFLLNLGLILSAPLWGAVSDRILKTRKLLVCWNFGFFALLLISTRLTGPETSLMLLSTLFFSIGLFQPSVLMFVQMKELMPLRMAGTAMASVNFFTMVGAAFFLQITGGLMQSLYPGASRSLAAFHTAFLLCGFLIASAAILYFFTTDTRSKA